MMRYNNVHTVYRRFLVSGIALLAALLVNVLLAGAVLAQATPDQFSLNNLSASAGGVVSTNNPGTQQVGSATVSVSANDPNQEYQVDQSSVSCTWSVANLTYSATANGTYGTPPSGAQPSFTFSPNPSSGGNTTTTIYVTTTAATIPGYWKFTVGVIVSFNTTNNGGSVTMTPTSVPNVGPVTVARLDISWSGAGVITNTMQSAVVGQQVSLQGIVTPSDLVHLDNTSGNGSIPGFAIEGENNDNNQGLVFLMLVYTGYQKTFYWVDSGSSRMVSYTLQVGGTSCTASATFNVASPQGISVTSQLGVAAIDQNYLNVADGIYWAHDGAVPSPVYSNTGAAGITWDVNYPATLNVHGSFTWLQAATGITRTVKRANGDTWSYIGGTFPALDGVLV